MSCIPRFSGLSCSANIYVAPPVDALTNVVKPSKQLEQMPQMFSIPFGASQRVAETREFVWTPPSP